jgi:hypothetical protein
MSFPGRAPRLANRGRLRALGAVVLGLTVAIALGAQDSADKPERESGTARFVTKLEAFASFGSMGFDKWVVEDHDLDSELVEQRRLELVRSRGLGDDDRPAQVTLHIDVIDQVFDLDPRSGFDNDRWSGIQVAPDLKGHEYVWDPSDPERSLRANGELAGEPDFKVLEDDQRFIAALEELRALASGELGRLRIQPEHVLALLVSYPSMAGDARVRVQSMLDYPNLRYFTSGDVDGRVEVKIAQSDTPSSERPIQLELKGWIEVQLEEADDHAAVGVPFFGMMEGTRYVSGTARMEISGIVDLAESPSGDCSYKLRAKLDQARRAEFCPEGWSCSTFESHWTGELVVEADLEGFLP